MTIIYTYTRAQAIEDGVLIDVSEMAKEAGIKWPVAVTAAVWALTEDILPEHRHQDVTGRLWDVLWMLRWAIVSPEGRLPGSTETEVLYRFVMHHDGEELVTLKAVSGPGDDLEPVITVMLPEED